MEETPTTRREFGKAVGAAGLVAPAVDPAAAAEARDGPLRPAVGDVATIDGSFTPTDWLAVGPFQAQSRESEVGWLTPQGGEDAFATGETTATTESRFQSAVAGGATVTWEERQARNGSLSLSFFGRVDPTGGDLYQLFGGPGVTDDVQDWFGLGGLLVAGYGFTVVESDARKRAVLETSGTAWLNGTRYEETPAGVVLEEGRNFLLVKEVGFVTAGAVSIQFREPRGAVEVNPLDRFRGTPQNAVLPDLRVGEETDRPASIRVTNTTSERVESATLRFAPEDGRIAEQTVEVDPPLAPFETRRVNTRVETTGPVPESAGPSGASVAETEKPVPAVALASTVTGETVSEETPSEATGGTASVGVEAVDGITVSAAVLVGGGSGSGDDGGSGSGGSGSSDGSSGSGGGSGSSTGGTMTDERAIPLRVRGADEPKKQDTFLSSIDESVQEYSIRLPANDDPPRDGWELLVTLHGANVPSINQAGGQYTQKEDTYILAPGARGPVNYDHEDLGRLDDLEAIEVLAERVDVDRSAVYLTGHSMGGHGTWHVGLTNPDRFAGLAPSAGWTDFDSYITTTLSRNNMHTFPPRTGVRDTGQYGNLALPKTENAADGTLPTFVLHGGEDGAVPPVHPRTFLRALANRGLDVEGRVGERFRVSPDERDVAYLEVPKADHYWDKDEFADTTIGPGTDTVNHPDLIDFLTSTERDPFPPQIQFFTHNLAVEDSKYWIGVELQETAQAPTRVSADATGGEITVQTENVAVLRLDPRAFREFGGAGRPGLVVDGRAISVPGRGGERPIYVDLRDGTASRTNPVSGVAKTSDLYGPVQEVHHAPYRLVYGTQGTDRETARARGLANLRSGRLVSRARAPAPVIPDTAVDRETAASYNLALFGRPSTNAVLQDVIGDTPLSVESGAVEVAGRRYEGDLAVQFVYPNPAAPDNLMQVDTGTTPAGLRLTAARNWIPTGTNAPDYAVFDESVRYRRDEA
ncbi:MAG: prolyl oligopeptidase family serine peptidase, partial [Halobaculum sp.]